MEEILFRIIIVGDSGVGKSCILKRFVANTFTEEHQVTIGVEFATKAIELNNHQVKLQIWDTAGQEGYRSITRSFYRNADGVILVYDISSKKSFESCEFWMTEIRNNSASDIIISMLGNQCDLVEANMREVLTSEAKAFSQAKNLNGFAEISAKSGSGVADAITEFCGILYDQWLEKNTVRPRNKSSRLELKADMAFKKKNNKCC